jgi:outer membrane biosynthesis protein TonB
MGKRPAFTDEELARAGAIAQTLRGETTAQTDPTVSPSRKIGYVGVISLTVLACAAGSFGILWLRGRAEPAATERPPKPTQAITHPAIDSIPSPTTAPPVVPTWQPQPTVSATSASATPAPRPTTDHPTPKPTPTPNQTSAPAFTPATVTAKDRSREHAQVALTAAERHFKYDYRVGSGNVYVLETNCANNRTLPVTGWSNRYRTTGQVGIGYYENVRNNLKQTSRGYEILTEEKDGVIEVIELTVKARSAP